MVRDRFPGDLTPWGTWGQIRKSQGRLPPRRKDGDWFLPIDAPGDSSLKGHCSRMDPVTQSHQVETLGDICQGKTTPWRRTQSMTQMQIWPTSCPHQHGKPKRHCMKWLIGQYQGRRQGPSRVRGMQISNVPHHWSFTSGNSWVRRNPPQWAPRWEAACHQHQHHFHHYQHLNIQNLPPCMPQSG